jgi:hypothetical protein
MQGSPRYGRYINLLEQFKKYLDYCKELKFEEDPDYEYIFELFTEVLNNLPAGPDFDWNNNLKSSSTMFNTTAKKTNISLVLGNGNISKKSPNNNDCSKISQNLDEVNKESLFRKG